MPTINEIFGSVMTKAGLTQEEQATYLLGESLTDEQAETLQNRLGTLMTRNAALVDDEIRKGVMRGTFEKVEGKVYDLIQGFTHKKIPKEELDKIWTDKKQMSEKMKSVFGYLDVAEDKDGFIPKMQFDALQSKYGELETKHKSGSTGWQERVDQLKQQNQLLIQEKQSLSATHATEMKAFKKQITKDKLLGFVKGKITGKQWQIEAAENKIIENVFKRAQFPTIENKMVARRIDNIDLEIYGANQQVELSPEQLVLEEANKLGCLDKQGANMTNGGSNGSNNGNNGTTRVPKDYSGNGQKGRHQRQQNNQSNKNVSPEMQRRLDATKAMAEQAGIEQ